MNIKEQEGNTEETKTKDWVSEDWNHMGGRNNWTQMRNPKFGADNHIKNQEKDSYKYSIQQSSGSPPHSKHFHTFSTHLCHLLTFFGARRSVFLKNYHLDVYS